MTTPRRMRWVVTVITLALVGGRGHAIGQQPAALLTASGVVVTTETAPRPVRRAIVSLRGSDFALGHHAITDDDGRFEIKGLTAGRYELSAKRQGFVTIAYGAARPEWPGTQLAIAAGQQLAGIKVQLAPGAVITGTVRDATGAPMANRPVSVERSAAAGGTFKRSATTDSQGAYRIYGLAAGTYKVSVQPLQTSATAMYARSDAEVDAIFQQLQMGRFGAPQAPVAQTAAPRSSVSDFAPIYYPSAFTSEDGIPVVVAAGEERAGIDMTVRLMSTSRLAGRVVESDGRPSNTGGVNLVRASHYATRSRSANVRADGTFEFSAVAPGRYQLVMWRASSIGVSSAPCEFAAADLEVAGGEHPEVQLVLKPCLKIAGRVEAAGDATSGTTRANLAGVPVRFEPDRSTGAAMDTQLPIVGTIGADGSFTVGGSVQLVPGSYLLQAGVTGNAPGTGWWMQSARTADGRDILDTPLSLTGTSPETTNVVLSFTDRHTSLSGSLVTAGDKPAIDYTVIAFTSNREWWRQPFRRVITARPATDGAFKLHDLLPGDYLLAALAEVAPNEWLDPVFLERVASQAVPVTIRPGEQKVQSLQIRGGTLIPPATGGVHKF